MVLPVLFNTPFWNAFEMILMLIVQKRIIIITYLTVFQNIGGCAYTRIKMLMVAMSHYVRTLVQSKRIYHLRFLFAIQVRIDARIIET